MVVFLKQLIFWSGVDYAMDWLLGRYDYYMFGQYQLTAAEDEWLQSVVVNNATFRLVIRQGRVKGIRRAQRSTNGTGGPARHAAWPALPPISTL